MRIIKGLSLFSNVGMAETYLSEVGVDIVIANELIKERAKFYKHLYPNCDVIQGDITDKNIFDEILNKAKKEKIDFLIATPPCQGMSLAGQKDPSDPRNYLIVYAIEMVKKIKPKYVLFENVPMQLKTKIIIDDKEYLIPEYIEKELGDTYNFNSFFNVK